MFHEPSNKLFAACDPYRTKFNTVLGVYDPTLKPTEHGEIYVLDLNVNKLKEKLLIHLYQCQ